MSERLTDEQLREWRDRRDPSGQPIHSEPVVPLIDDILALRARVAQLEAALLYVKAAIVKSEPDDFPIGEAISKLEAALKEASQ